MPWVAHEGAWRRPGHVVPFNGGPPPQTFYLGSSSADDWTNIDSQLRNLNGSKPGEINNGLAVRRSFNSGGIPSSFMNSAAGEDVARGVASIWSCKPSLQDVASGGLDNAWTNFFNSIPAGHRAWLCMWHEPWDDFNGDNLWPAYRAAQARVYDLLQASSADKDLVKWGIITTAYDYQQGRADLMFPEDNSKFSWVGVDGYNFWRPASAPPDPRGRDSHRTPQQIYGPARNFAIAQGNKPLIVAEWSHHDNPLDHNQRPTRVDESINWMLNNNTVAASYFHSHHGDSGPWWLNCHHNYNSPQDQSDTDENTLSRYRDWLALYGKPIGG